MRKKLLAIILAMVMCLTILPVEVLAKTAVEMDYGEVDYSLTGIGSLEEMEDFARQINEGAMSYYQKTVWLRADIGDANDPFRDVITAYTYDVNWTKKGATWTDEELAIEERRIRGDLVNDFNVTFTFDGGGHTIWLDIDKPNEDVVALFSGCFSNDYICNLTVRGSVKGRDCVGAISALGARMDNCHNYADVTGRSGVGGLAGGGGADIAGGSEQNGGNFLSSEEVEVNSRLLGTRADGPTIITNCSNHGKVTAKADWPEEPKEEQPEGKTEREMTESFYSKPGMYVGGIVGMNNGFIANCSNHGDVSGGSYVGGIAGTTEESAFVMNCYNARTVTTATATDYCGGITGDSTEPYNCYDLQEVKGNKDANELLADLNKDAFATDEWQKKTMAEIKEAAAEGIAATYTNLVSARESLKEAQDAYNACEAEVEAAQEKVNELTDVTGAEQALEEAKQEFKEAEKSLTEAEKKEESATATYTDLRGKCSTQEEVLRKILFLDSPNEKFIAYLCRGWEIRKGENEGYPVFKPLPKVKLEGSGTQRDPYQIWDLDDLQEFADAVNGIDAPWPHTETFAGKYVKVMADITDPLTTPIGIHDSFFRAAYFPDFDKCFGTYRMEQLGVIFDGDGHSIAIDMKADSLADVVSQIDGCKDAEELLKTFGSVQNLMRLYRADECVGLFGGGYADSCQIKNLTVTGSLDISTPGQHIDAGGVIGCIGGEVSLSHCCSDVHIHGIIDTDNPCSIGGVTGSIGWGLVYYCKNIADIDDIQWLGKDEHALYVGGIAGRACFSAPLFGCCNEGDIQIDFPIVAAGGIIGGGNSSAVFCDCENRGDVYAPKAAVVGGIAAATAPLFVNCGNTGNITGGGIVGGIVGEVVSTTKGIDIGELGTMEAILDGTPWVTTPYADPNPYGVYNSFNTGDITGFLVGGIVGLSQSFELDRMIPRTVITKPEGSVFITPENKHDYHEYVVTVENCYNAGKVSCDEELLRNESNQELMQAIMEIEENPEEKPLLSEKFPNLLEAILGEEEEEPITPRRGAIVGTDVANYGHEGQELLSKIENCYYNADTIGEGDLWDESHEGINSLPDELCCAEGSGSLEARLNDYVEKHLSSLYFRDIAISPGQTGEKEVRKVSCSFEPWNFSEESVSVSRYPTLAAVRLTGEYEEENDCNLLRLLRAALVTKLTVCTLVCGVTSFVRLTARIAAAENATIGAVTRAMWAAAHMAWLANAWHMWH